MKKENEKTKRQLIVDRKEGEYAVCEQTDKRMISLPLTQLPAGIREGDVLAEENGKYWIDRAATQKRKKEVDAKWRTLIRK